MGAYGGEYAYRMARAVGATGRVFAFEPFPRYFRVLKRALELAGISNVVLKDTALAQSAGQALLVHTDEEGNSLVGRVNIRGDAEGGDAQDVGVETSDLDTLAAANNFVDQVRLLKIDVEGMELSVLRGARSLLAASAPVLICEVEDRHCMRYGHTRRDVIDFMTSLGYAAFVMAQNGMRIVPLTPDATNNNLLFIPKMGASEIAARINEADQAEQSAI